jgi:hypothetical protein
VHLVAKLKMKLQKKNFFKLLTQRNVYRILNL